MIEAERYVGTRMNVLKLVQYEFRLKIKRKFLYIRKIRFCISEPKTYLRPQLVNVVTMVVQVTQIHCLVVPFLPWLLDLCRNFPRVSMQTPALGALLACC